MSSFLLLQWNPLVFISLDFLLHNVDNFSFLCIYSNFELVSVGIEIGNKNLSSGVFLNRWSIGRFCKSFFSPEETTAEDISKVPMTLYVPGSCCKNHISWVKPFVKMLVVGKKVNSHERKEFGRWKQKWHRMLFVVMPKKKERIFTQIENK